MEQGAVFQSNRSQAIRLPKAVPLPDDVKRVDIGWDALPGYKVDDIGWNVGSLEDLIRARGNQGMTLGGNRYDSVAERDRRQDQRHK